VIGLANIATLIVITGPITFVNTGFGGTVAADWWRDVISDDDVAIPTLIAFVCLLTLLLLSQTTADVVGDDPVTCCGSERRC